MLDGLMNDDADAHDDGDGVVAAAAHGVFDQLEDDSDDEDDALAVVPAPAAQQQQQQQAQPRRQAPAAPRQVLAQNDINEEV